MVKVSVIIPNYNHARYLRERIDSILAQSFKEFELIILDDASTDNSREIILEYAKMNPWIITCFNDQNSGSPFKQWNKGVTLAQGEYVWIAESDDFAEPDFLKNTVAELLKSDNIGLVFSDTIILDEQRRIKYLFSDRKKANNIVKFLTLKSFIRNPIPNVSSVLFRKSAYLEAGCADETMRFCGDWFLYLRIKNNLDIKYIPEPLSTFRLHEHSRYHHHFRENGFIREKLRICRYIIKASKFSPLILFPFLISMLASYGLRLVHLKYLPSCFVPELPRLPHKVEYI